MSEKFDSILDVVKQINEANEIIFKNLSDDGSSTLNDRLSKIGKQQEKIESLIENINKKLDTYEPGRTPREVSLNKILHWLNQNGKSTIASASDLRFWEVRQLMERF